MKVTFDSNTWRKVASPVNFPKDPIVPLSGQTAVPRIQRFIKIWSS